jgi:predicted O-linked N-acetylglucosamine transferase (SPINDLY family)
VSALIKSGKFDLAKFELSQKRELGDNAYANYNLGVCYFELGQLDEAALSYQRAIAIKPDLIAAQINLGNVQSKTGQVENAILSYQRVIDICPDVVEAHINLGSLFYLKGQLENASECYRRSLVLRPDCAEAHRNIGIIMNDMGRFEEAAKNYQMALAIKPDYTEAYSSLGVALQNLGNLQEAILSYQKALELDPSFTTAYSNMLLIKNYVADVPGKTLLADAIQFGQIVERLANTYTNWTNSPEKGKCIKIGIVSGDLRNHPVGYFAEGVLTELANQDNLKVIVYHNSVREDELSRRIRGCCRAWYSVVEMSDQNLAFQIRQDGIDILFDLSGHTAQNRLPLFAWKPAPIQVSWLGYFATTGVAAVDYLIADPWTVPDDEEIQFTEKIVRMPETRLCFTRPDIDIETSGLPAIKNGYITFGCFNNLSKMNDAVIELWARVLESIPSSRLFLKAMQLNDPVAQKRVALRFSKAGINPNRLILEGFSNRKDYFAAYHRVDIAVDPFPFPGGTTSVEGLWMGVPVLTLAGGSLLSRQGVGILSNMEMTEWIAHSHDEYVKRAIMHASDLTRLSELRKCLRDRLKASPLLDASRFARQFNDVLRSMWVAWCDKLILSKQ